MSEKFEQFKAFLQKTGYYEQATALQYWDLQTAAPEEAKEDKTELLTWLSTEKFRLETSEEYADLLKALAEPAEYDVLPEEWQLTVRRFLRDYEKLQRVPEEFYSEYVRTTALGNQAWEKAKTADDYSLFAPHLEKIISMTKQLAAYTDPDKEPYNAMIDNYEEGMTTEQIDPIFEDIKAGLKPLLEYIAAHKRPFKQLSGTYDINAQKEVQKYLLNYIGFNFNAGTTGESMHPFTMGLCMRDIRVTNHFSETNPVDPMFSAIHEGGHAIFEQSINPAFKHTAAANIDLMGLHESQSRFFENILGKNIHFWEPIYGDICRLLPRMSEIPLEDFDLLINDVKPTMIRTSADEVTYCLHVILRYEIEKAIIRENADVKDLPEMWNAKMKELLGICPANDREGILQDMHWSDGSIGYFPSYLLGSVYDGMYIRVIERELGSIDTLLAEGRIREIKEWLGTHIHQYGSMYLSNEVMERIGAGPLSAAPLLEYFYKKYGYRK